MLDKPDNGHWQGQPLALPFPPASTPRTCLQESSAGGAQEHHGVVIDAGDRHRGEAVVGEDGGGGDGVHDGQRVLQVRCSAVQLLRLQLWGHTRALAAAPGQVLPSATRAQASEPKANASLPSHSTRKCRSIRGQELPCCGKEQGSSGMAAGAVLARTPQAGVRQAGSRAHSSMGLLCHTRGRCL